MMKLNSSLKQKVLSIKLIAFDFDGVFTDNRVFINEEGKESVACNRSDGIGLERIRNLGIKTCIISSEPNPLVIKRSEKLKIPCVHNCPDKLKALLKVAKECSISLKETAFLGNDINDIECLKSVGLPTAVSDCHPELDKIVLVKTERNGGSGAVRELCDLIYNVKSEKRR
ncbi:MAG: HAD hydrolase family protein [Candidatus Omnitrophota bacterium]